MGKNSKKRKRANQARLEAEKGHDAGAASILSSSRMDQEEPGTETDEEESTLISDQDLSTTLRTLQKLVAQQPHREQFHSKRFKDLRRTLHPLVVEQLQSYDKGVDYRVKVTQALAARHWSDALAALEACHDYQQRPKQGTVQRWVRDCTEAGVVGCQMQLLQAILRVSCCAGANDSDHPTTTTDGTTTDTTAAVDAMNNKHDPAQALAHHLMTQPQAKDKIVILEGWKWWEKENNHENDSAQDEKKEEGEEEKNKEMDSKKNNNEEDSKAINIDMDILPLKSRILYQEAAAERTPPNHYDLILHTTDCRPPGSQEQVQSCIQWTSPPPPTAFHPVSFLPTPARVLSNVFSPAECHQLLHHITSLGYRPDHPVALPTPTGIDSCEWMIDDTMARVLFQRVQPHLPATLTLPNKRVQLHSINPRWRCFRYQQDCVYRPHLDGSWPQSYIDPTTGTYCCPKQSTALKSYLTFLIYLNQEFEGGETRFYLPDGTARGIVPQTGCVTVFPQGNVSSLIHEGSQVTRGTKYVIRTDVLYNPSIPNVNGGDDDGTHDHKGKGTQRER